MAGMGFMGMGRNEKLGSLEAGRLGGWEMISEKLEVISEKRRLNRILNFEF